MATEVLQTTDAPSNNVYFALWNTSGNVFDFSDNTFKALGSATTPYVAATENTNQGGVNESGYRASVNLANVNSTPAVAVYIVEAYRRLGGSPALTTDVMLARTEMRVANGTIVAGGGPGDVLTGYAVKVGMNVTSTAGDEAQLYAWVEFNGQPVIVSGTCVFSCYEYGGTVAQWTESGVANNAIGQFETVKATPNFNDDVKYLLQAAITIGSVTITGQEAFPVIGGA